MNSVRKFFTGFTLLDDDVDVHPRCPPLGTRAGLKVASDAGVVRPDVQQLKPRAALRGRAAFVLRRRGGPRFGFDPAWLEDEVWTRIRLAAGGRAGRAVNVVPGSSTRASGTRTSAEKAEAEPPLRMAARRSTRATTPRFRRKLAIRFEADRVPAPDRVVGGNTAGRLRREPAPDGRKPSRPAQPHADTERHGTPTRTAARSWDDDVVSGLTSPRACPCSARPANFCSGAK